jgi:hypothetical protein
VRRRASWSRVCARESPVSLAVAAAEALLYGLAPRDPLTFALAGALMAAITCLASVGPAWRPRRSIR